MSKEKQHIDDFLRSSLEGYEVKPSRSFWKNINGKTNLFGNRLLWKLGIPLLLLVGGAYIYDFKMNDSAMKDSRTPSETRSNSSRFTKKNKDLSLKQSDKITEIAPKILREGNIKESTQPDPEAKDFIPIRQETDNRLNAIDYYPAKVSERRSSLSKITRLPLLFPSDGIQKNKIPKVSLFQNSGKGKNNKGAKKPETRLFLSSGFNFTSLSSDTITELRNYEFGLEASVKISPALHLQSGLLYNRIKDRGYGKWEYTTYENVGTLNIVFTINGEYMADDTTYYVLQQMPIYDSIDHTITGRIKSKASYFKIPLKLRYNILSLPRMDIEVTGGITAHLLDEQTYIYEKLDNKYFSPLLPERERIYLSSSAGWSFTYYFRKNTGVWMQPQIYIPIDSPFKWDTRLQDYQFSVRAGVVIKL